MAKVQKTLSWYRRNGKEQKSDRKSTVNSVYILEDFKNVPSQNVVCSSDFTFRFIKYVSVLLDILKLIKLENCKNL